LNFNAELKSEKGGDSSMLLKNRLGYSPLPNATENSQHAKIVAVPEGITGQDEAGRLLRSKSVT